jgi:hypothetical protein
MVLHNIAVELKDEEPEEDPEVNIPYFDQPSNIFDSRMENGCSNSSD